MNVKLNQGVLYSFPGSKMLMKVKLPDGVKKLDFGTLIFNPTDAVSRSCVPPNEVVVERGKFPADNWLKHCVGIIADANGLELDSTGCCYVSTNISIN